MFVREACIPPGPGKHPIVALVPHGVKEPPITFW